MDDPSYDNPEEAARGSKASADVLALAESPDGRWAVVIVDKGKPGSPYLLQVICERRDDGWRGGYDTNQHGYTALPQPLEPNAQGEYAGVVTHWDKAPPNVRSVSVRWRGLVHAVPVQNGYFLFAAWDVPERYAETWPQII